MKLKVLKFNNSINLERAEQVCFPFLIIVSCFLYSSLYFFNTFPISESWTVYYVEMIQRGNVPYRDFYYYLPPLNLIVDYIFWKLSFGYLLIYRGWYLLQRIVMLLLLYRLLCRYFSRRSSFLTVSITSILLTACVYDLFGDYNQTMAFLAVIMLYPTTAFSVKKNKFQLILAGFILGLMFLNKPPIFVASCLCWLLALIVYCILEKDYKFFHYFLFIIMGMTLPLSICYLILAPQGAFIPFIEQAFLHTEGKGDIIHILFINTFRNLLPSMTGALMLCVIFTYLRKLDLNCLPIQIYKKTVLSRWALLLLASVIGLLFLIYISICMIPLFHRYIPRNIAGLFLIIISILSAIFGIIIVQAKTVSIKDLILLFYFAFNIICAFFAVSLPVNTRLSITSSHLFDDIQVIVPYLGIFCLIICLYCAAKNNTYLGFLACGAFTLYYSHAMGAGSTPPMNTQVFIISLPLVLCIIIERPPKLKLLKAILYGGIFALVTLAITICAVQKKTIPYSWWGQTNTPAEQKIFEVALPAMAGLRLTNSEVEMYNEISELILLNTNENDEVWGYPYIRIFNVLTNRYTLRTFVPVLFPDVVGDIYVQQALDMIKEHNPSIILWKDLPECLSDHEKVFRNGEPLKQRLLEKEIKHMIPYKYQLLGYYNGVQIYRLKEEQTSYVKGNIDEILNVGKIEQLCITSEGETIETYKCQTTNPLSFDTPVKITLSLTPLENETTVLLKQNSKVLQKWKLTAEKECSKLQHCFYLPPGSVNLTVNISTQDSYSSVELSKKHLTNLHLSCE